MIFFRNLKMNLSEAQPPWLLGAVEHHLGRIDVGWEDGVIGLQFMETAFEALNEAEGRELVILWWTFGDTESEVFENTGRLFENLGKAVGKVNQDLKRSMADGPLA